MDEEKGRRLDRLVNVMYVVVGLPSLFAVAMRFLFPQVPFYLSNLPLWVAGAWWVWQVLKLWAIQHNGHNRETA